jgi:hypothetical protein
MGKKLILFGVDYDDSSMNKLTKHQMALSITTTDGGYLLDNNTKRLALTLEDDKPLLIPSGHCCILSGLLGTDGQQTALAVDYCAYTSGDTIPTYSSSPHAVNPNLSFTASGYTSSNYFCFNRIVAVRQPSILITNNSSTDYYYAFACKKIDDSDVDITKYSISYNVIPL